MQAHSRLANTSAEKGHKKIFTALAWSAGMQAGLRVSMQIWDSLNLGEIRTHLRFGPAPTWEGPLHCYHSPHRCTSRGFDNSQGLLYDFSHARLSATPSIQERGALLIFGVGTDIIEVKRVEEKLERTRGLKARLFTEGEIAYCGSKHRPAQHFAARFSAKEAFLKAMGTGWTGGHKFSEIEIVNDALGKPELKIHGKVEEFCRDHGITGMQVSLSHIRDLAKAVVVLEIISSDTRREA